LIHKGTTVLDYGCGRGYDFKALIGMGLDATGYDPGWGPFELPAAKADVVLCSFVLNVLSCERDREAVVKAAVAHAREGVLFSVRTDRDRPDDGWVISGDGWRSATGWFQRFFKAAELEGLLHGCTGLKPRTIKHGIVWLPL
jgi:DNA phosphorothioation-associated putative methyltransferase